MIKYVAQFENWDEAVEFSHQVLRMNRKSLHVSRMREVNEGEVEDGAAGPEYQVTRADLKAQIAAIVFDSNLWESDRRPSEALCHTLAGEIIDQLDLEIID